MDENSILSQLEQEIDVPSDSEEEEPFPADEDSDGDPEYVPSRREQIGADDEDEEDCNWPLAMGDSHNDPQPARKKGRYIPN